MPVCVDLQTEAMPIAGPRARSRNGDAPPPPRGGRLMGCRGQARAEVASESSRPSSRAELTVECTEYEQPGAVSPMTTHPNARPDPVPLDRMFLHLVKVLPVHRGQDIGHLGQSLDRDLCERPRHLPLTASALPSMQVTLRRSGRSALSAHLCHRGTAKTVTSSSSGYRPMWGANPGAIPAWHR